MSAGPHSPEARATSEAREGEGPETPRQQYGRHGGGQSAQGGDVCAAGGTLAAVHQGEPIALARWIEDAEGQPPHQRTLLLTAAAIAARLDQPPHLPRHAGPPRSPTLHQLAHPRLADPHARSGLSPRQSLQIAEHRRLALASAETTAQRLEQMTQPRAVVELGGQIVLLRGCRLDAVGQLAMSAASCRGREYM